MDEQALGRALKNLDPKLVLQKHRRDSVEGGWVYKVLRVWSDSHEPAIILTWMDERGRPLPLSSGLIDETQRHMLGARNKGPDADEYNRLHEHQARRDNEAASAELILEHRARLAGRTQVSLAHKQRKGAWRKTNGGRVTR